MSYSKQTVISGYKNVDQTRNHTTLCVSVLNGHWADDTVINFANKRKLDPATVKFSRNVIDLSGNGRGTHGGDFGFVYSEVENNYDIVRLSQDSDADDSEIDKTEYH